MENGAGFELGVFVGIVAATAWWAVYLRIAPPSPPSRAQPSVDRTKAPVSDAKVRESRAAGSEKRDLEALFTQIDQAFDQISSLDEAESVDPFRVAVETLSSSAATTEDLLKLANASPAARAMVGIEALRRRKTLVPDPFVALAPALAQSFGARAFAQRYIAQTASEPVLGRLVGTLDPNFVRLPWFASFWSGILRLRAEVGEHAVDFDQLRACGSALLSMVAESLGGALSPDVTAFRDRLASIARELEAEEVLRRIGKLSDGVDTEPIVLHPALVAKRDEVLSKIDGVGGTRRSILVVGGAGVGKSTLVSSVLARRIEAGDAIFEASAADVIAGQRFVGEHEERVKVLLQSLASGRRKTWVIPRFQELAHTGRTLENPTSTLDLVLPSIERGEIHVIGEASSVAVERLLRRMPRLRSTFEIVRVEPLSESDTLTVAREVLSRRSAIDGGGRAGGFAATSDATLREAQQLVHAYATDQESPGRLLTFLRRACEVVIGSGAEPRAIERKDLLDALSRTTGLPTAILDESTRLDLAEPAAFFASRVLGQDEAVRTLVDRIGMLKAGLCDPKRPIGVYLFTGPTGTGKTELAKALAEYLFGSSERMLRFDMSEFQSPDSLDRLVGSSSPFSDRTGGGGALVDRIREQPFAVVLLDEFEKAHPSVFDLFLQLFDDGRLTDRQGNTADFRHAIVIMTSNLGGDVVREASIGFTKDRVDSVARAMSGAFRKEFINRIDRVVAFQPLSRSVMRDVLMKELALVLERRGLRNRQWAFEWENSAIEFLLERGFTPDLGARPLRRAIEQHLLAPLARTILEHRVPMGDQFLFVRSDGDRLEVEFVDPDAPMEPNGVEVAVEAPAAIGLKDLVLDATGEPSELSMLARQVERIGAVFSGAAWRERKAALFDAMGGEGFWNSPARFVILEEAEYRDRLEVGFASAESLWQRLSQHHDRKGDRVPPHLLQRLAHDLYLLDEAIAGLERGEAPDAWILVEAELPEGGAPITGAVDWAQRVFSMYAGFCQRRRMKFEDLSSQVAASTGGTPIWRGLLAVSGFAAYAILRKEHGLHVFEVRPDEGRTRRFRTRVRVLPQPPTPPPRAVEERARGALSAFAAAGDPLGIARRYTEDPSPLVRDAVRSFRTGRLDRVLVGDFDLF